MKPHSNVLTVKILHQFCAMVKNTKSLRNVRDKNFSNVNNYKACEGLLICT